VDKLHALTNSKRGDLLALGLARLSAIAPHHRRIGLSATVAEPDQLRRYLLPQPSNGQALADLVMGEPGAVPKVSILVPTNPEPQSEPQSKSKALEKSRSKSTFVQTRKEPSEVRIPWSGHSAKHALQAVYEQILRSQTVLVFVNTRSQAEFVFQTTRASQ